MCDDPVGEMNGLVNRHLCLRGTLYADNDVKNNGHRHEAQRDFLGDQACAPLREHQVGYHDDDNDAKQRRGSNRRELCFHRDD